MEVGKELVWHRCGIVFCLIMSLITFLRIVKRSLATTKTVAALNINSLAAVTFPSLQTFASTMQ